MCCWSAILRTDKGLGAQLSCESRVWPALSALALSAWAPLSPSCCRQPWAKSRSAVPRAELMCGVFPSHSPWLLLSPGRGQAGGSSSHHCWWLSPLSLGCGVNPCRHWALLEVSHHCWVLGNEAGQSVQLMQVHKCLSTETAGCSSQHLPGGKTANEAALTV